MSNKYNLGDRVKFNQVVGSYKKDGQRRLLLTPFDYGKSLVGMITGMKYVYGGDIDNEEVEQNCWINSFEIKKSLKVYEVKCSLMNKPFNVREEDIIEDYRLIFYRECKDSLRNLFNLDTETLKFKTKLICLDEFLPMGSKIEEIEPYYYKRIECKYRSCCINK